mmetsp:Transcript_21241/g.48803  ORF Transcript_21241/g.48803 Transcript_21241/m.48803 type:complete len:370 (-) Transcript_21241:36-1145(-)
MAKYLGAYAGIAGGSEPYALMAFTGFPLVYCFQRPSVDDREVAAVPGVWEWLGAQYATRDLTGPVPASIPGMKGSMDSDQVWTLLLDFDARNYLMTASITRFMPPRSMAGYFREDGLVLGHAYSMLSCRSLCLSSGEWVHLVMLRNPHGEGEATAEGVFSTKWRGDWSDTCSLWKEHQEVAEQVAFSPRNDGTFWMSWDDFTAAFDKVCVLPKSMEERRGGIKAFVDRAPVREVQKDPKKVGLSLARMADEEMWRDFAQLRAVYDPFLMCPGFLKDGTMDMELRWAATKPGRLQSYLDLNLQNGNEGGAEAIRGIVAKYGMEEALGPEGYVGGLIQDGVQTPAVTAARRQYAPKQRARSRTPARDSRPG